MNKNIAMTLMSSLSAAFSGGDNISGYPMLPSYGHRNYDRVPTAKSSFKQNDRKQRKLNSKKKRKR